MTPGPAAKNLPENDRPSLLEASWTPEALVERGWKGSCKATWRVIATTWHGVRDNRLPQQAAALTYYTLMSLGPLLALALIQQPRGQPRQTSDRRGGRIHRASGRSSSGGTRPDGDLA
ncbi:MAG: hypothetical protein EBS64_10130 [Verrucomicrobia bacterium]|nr:hypothetical protein [Verrucomicrobiota bacterium]